MGKMKKGMTLIEILTAMAIMLLVFTAVFNLFIPSLRIWKVGDLISNMQYEGSRAQRDLLKELTESTPLLVFNATTNDPSLKSAISFPSARSNLELNGNFQTAPTTITVPITGTITVERPVWQGMVVYYRDPATQTLRRHVRLIATPPGYSNPIDPRPEIPDVADEILGHGMEVPLFEVLGSGEVPGGAKASPPPDSSIRVFLQVKRIYGSKSDPLNLEAGKNMILLETSLIPKNPKD